MTYRPSTVESIITKMWEEIPNWLGEDAVAELLPSLTDLFINETPTLLTRLTTAVRVGNGRETYEIAHYLKGGSRALGLVTFSQLCKELEAAGEQDDMESAALLLSQIMIEYGQVEKAMLSMTLDFDCVPL